MTESSQFLLFLVIGQIGILIDQYFRQHNKSTSGMKECLICYSVFCFFIILAFIFILSLLAQPLCGFFLFQKFERVTSHGINSCQLQDVICVTNFTSLFYAFRTESHSKQEPSPLLAELATWNVIAKQFYVLYVVVIANYFAKQQ